jgi:hypothetical protein
MASRRPVGNTFNTGYLDGQEMVRDATTPPACDYNFGNETVRQFFADVADKRVCWLGRGFLSNRPAQQYLHGAIDELRIYERPLSGAEILTYYNSVSPRVPRRRLHRLL